MSAPFVWIFVCFVLGILCGRNLDISDWVLVPGFLAALLAFCGRFRIAVIAHSLLLLLISACYTEKLESSYDANVLRLWARNHSKEVVLFSGTLLRTPEISPDYYVMQIRVESIGEATQSGIARVTVSGPMKSPLVVGDRIESFGRFRLPRNFQTDGAFDYDRYLRAEGIHVLGSIKSHELIRMIRSGKGFFHFVSTIRLRSILKTMGSFSERDANILRALWLDDRGGLNQQDQQILMDAGVFHVIAISGFHITVLLFLLFLLFKRFISFRSAALVACLLLSGYFLVLEGRASVTRSFLSFLIFAFAVWKHDRISLGNWICLSAWIQLILNPLEIYDSGFHLTYLSTATILFLIVPLSSKWIRLRKIYQYLINFFLTAVVIQVVLIPYQIYVFHRIPIHSVLANTIAIPVSSLLIALSVFFLPLPGVSLLLRAPIHALLTGFLTAGDFFAEQGIRILPSPPLYLLFVFYLALAGFVVVRKRFLKVFCLAISIVAFLLVFRTPPAHPGPLRIHMLDVGQGDSILIEYPDRTFDLIDGGGFFNSDALDTGQSILIPYFCKKGITRLNRVFLTHAHADHMNGLISVLKYIPVSQLYVSRQPYGDRGYQNFLVNVSQTPKPICRGKTFTQGAVQLEVLAPEDAKKTRKVANDDSLVLMLTYENHRILLTGDIEAEAEQKLSFLIKQRVDYFKVPHHGSKTSSTELLLNQLKPRVAFVSVGYQNWFGHPNQEVLKRLRQHHVTLFRTDAQGTLILEFSRGYTASIIN